MVVEVVVMFVMGSRSLTLSMRTSCPARPQSFVFRSATAVVARVTAPATLRLESCLVAFFSLLNFWTGGILPGTSTHISDNFCRTPRPLSA